MAATYQPPQWLIPKNANTDKVGNYCFEFDGVDDYFDLGTSQTYTNVSISFWVKRTTDPSNESLFNGTGIFQWLQFTSNQNYLSYYDGSWNVFSGDVSDDDWHHVVIINDISATEVRSYVDGSLDTTISSYDATSILYQFGNYNGVSHFLSGKYTEICIFNYILDTDDITTLYGSAGAGVGNPMGLASPPIAYYKGDRAALGDQWAVPNQVSQDYVFDFETTSNQYIALGTDSSLQPSSAFTISGWIQKEDTNAYAIFGNVTPDGTGSPGFVLWLIYNKLRCDIETSAGLKYKSGGTTIAASSEWHHVAATWDVATGTINIYLDGVIDLTPVAGFASDIVYQAGSEGFIGRKGGYEWDGLMSNFAFWDSALTAGNILTLYNNGTPETAISFSPVSWWKLDDSATFSTNWSIPDAGSASNTGTSSGMTQANLIPDTVTRGTTLYSNYSFEFDGVGDYFDCGDSNAFTFALTPFSVSVWVNITDATNFVSLAKDNTGAREWTIRAVSDKLHFYILDNVAGGYIGRLYNTTVTSYEGSWIHTVYTYDGGTSNGGIKIYLNGVQVDDANYDSGTFNTMQNTATALRIGSQENGPTDSDGKISNAAIFNSELSAANILTIYNNGRPADLTSLSPISWWRMGEDASWDGSDWTIRDQIGSNDGTSAGNPNLVGDAPQSFANGLSVSMDIDDRIGESGFSDENALSYNMAYDSRKEDVPG